MSRSHPGHSNKGAQPDSMVQQSHASQHMTSKVLVLYIMLTLALPCAFLFSAEIVLRLFHAGYDTRFFLREKRQDSVYCVDNPVFSRRFFPSTLVRSPEKIRFPLRKGDNERRIFVLGSSAAQGEPAPAFGFSRNLSLMMQGRYGSTRCDIINTAITATNSHVVVPIARECSNLSPDIFVVYLGNNEVIGPFGPGTVFSHFSSLWFIRLRIFLSSTKIGQLASTVSELIAQRKGIPAGWGGMKMFLQHKIRFCDPRMAAVYQNYRENLSEICRAARKGGAHVVLCTVASNMKDCGPFFSMHNPDITADLLKQWEGYYQQAVDSQRQGRPDTALVLFSKAAALDSTNAEMHFRMAQCLFTLGRFDEARQHFIAARDYDALRFRADSRLNLIVKDVVREFADCAVLFDAEERLAATSDHGIYGEELFLEHVHYNFHGNYLFAANLLPLLDSLIALPVVDHHTASEVECRERLAYNLWEELGIGQEIYNRLTKPPFTNQEDNLRRAKDFQKENQWLSVLVADSGQNIIADYQRAASLELNDWRIYNQAGKYLLRNNNNAAAEQAFRMVLDILPNDQYARNDLAIVLERQNRTAEAVNYCREAIRIDPLFFEAYITLADGLIKNSNINEAESCIKKVLRINPELPQAQERFAQVLLMRGKATPDGRYFKKNAIFRIALAAFYNKDGLRFEQEGNIQEAIKNFEYAAGIYSESIDVQCNLGRVLLREGKLKEGIGHFKEAVRIDSTRLDVHVNFADALAARGLMDDAVKEYQAVLLINPKMLPALNALGLLFIQQDSIPQAIDLFVRAIDEQPSMLGVHKNLIAACTYMNQKSRAIDILTQMSASHPKTAEIHYSLGKLLLEQGSAAEAKKQLSIAAQLRPDLPDLESLLSAASSTTRSVKH